MFYATHFFKDGTVYMVNRIACQRTRIPPTQPLYNGQFTFRDVDRDVVLLFEMRHSLNHTSTLR